MKNRLITIVIWSVFSAYVLSIAFVLIVDAWNGH